MQSGYFLARHQRRDQGAARDADSVLGGGGRLLKLALGAALLGFECEVDGVKEEWVHIALHREL